MSRIIRVSVVALRVRNLLLEQPEVAHRSGHKNDPAFKVQALVFKFQVGEHPQLPLEGNKFIRFSSNVSEATAAAT